MSQSVLFHVETIQQNSVKAWILNNWTTREDHLKRFLKKNPGGSVFFTSRFRGPLELQRYLSLIILKISAFFPCLIRINRKLNTVTPQLSILRRDKNVFLGELVHKAYQCLRNMTFSHKTVTV